MTITSCFILAAATLGLATTLQSAPAAAGSDTFVGEMMLTGSNFCPRGYAAAHGQLLAISSNSALFSLLGTTYGGDGRTSFGLPDLRGRTPVGTGAGPGLQNIAGGQRGGSQTQTLSPTQLPSHTHGATTAVTADVKLRGAASAADKRTPAGNVPALTAAGTFAYNAGPAAADMVASAIQANVTATTTVSATGGNQGFDNRDPYLGMLWCIATVGIYPSRN